MKIAVVRLVVEDVPAARGFHAGLPGLHPVSLEPATLIFDGGPLQLMGQADAEARADGLVGRFAGVSLEVADITALHDRLEGVGCAIVGPPERQPWGGMPMPVKDPSGNIVSFVQNQRGA